MRALSLPQHVQRLQTWKKIGTIFTILGKIRAEETGRIKRPPKRYHFYSTSIFAAITENSFLTKNSDITESD